VLANVSLTVRRGERVGIIGPNGLGKSTLLKIAVERLDADAGRVRWGHEARPGYFPQDHREVLTDGETTPLSILEEACPGESPTFVRGQLGRVLFSGEESRQEGPPAVGGRVRAPHLRAALRREAERARARRADQPPRPRGHPRARRGAEAVHGDGDLRFARSLVRLRAGHPDHRAHARGPNDFPGTYAEYLARCGDDHLDGDAVVLKAKRARAETASTGDDGAALSSALSWEERKRRRNRVAQLPKLRDKVMAAIEAAEARKQAIHDRYADPTFYAKTSHDEIDALARGAGGARTEAGRA
jgi:energy-coupling factor transporter ATP-binding protein EcfA2